MPGLLVNIDVPDIAAGEVFYAQAFGLTVGRRLGADFVGHRFCRIEFNSEGYGAIAT